MLALKCHKKQLELSWISNDENQELRAYELIGKVYFYMGEIYKCKMYHDRSQFGVIEPKDSKIRQIFTTMSDVNSARLHQKLYGGLISSTKTYNLKNIRDILEAFSKVSRLSENDNLTKRWRKICESNVQGDSLKNPEDYYRNGLTQIVKPMFLRPGTPISQIDFNELPSPRALEKNIKNDQIISKSELKQRQVACNRAWLHSEASVMAGGKTRYKEQIHKIMAQMREKRQRSLKINVETDLRKIVNKALALGKNRRDMNERP